MMLRSANTESYVHAYCRDTVNVICSPFFLYRGYRTMQQVVLSEQAVSAVEGEATAVCVILQV